MSFSITNNSFVNSIGLGSKATAPAATTASAPAYNMGSDSVKLSGVANGPNQPLPTEAGGWKKFSNSVGEMFSNIADKLKFGETYKLIDKEFNQVDTNRSGNLNIGEFNVATLNILDFWGREFAVADKDRNGSVDKGEYVDYRKQQLSNAFERKDRSADRHLNVNEVGFIGQQMLVNRDPRFDANQDGLINKREFVRSVVQGTMNIREFLGL